MLFIELNDARETYPRLLTIPKPVKFRSPVTMCRSNAVPIIAALE